MSSPQNNSESEKEIIKDIHIPRRKTANYWWIKINIII